GRPRPRRARRDPGRPARVRHAGPPPPGDGRAARCPRRHGVVRARLPPLGARRAGRRGRGARRARRSRGGGGDVGGGGADLRGGPPGARRGAGGARGRRPPARAARPGRPRAGVAGGLPDGAREPRARGIHPQPVLRAAPWDPRGSGHRVGARGARRLALGCRRPRPRRRRGAVPRRAGRLPRPARAAGGRGPWERRPRHSRARGRAGGHGAGREAPRVTGPVPFLDRVRETAAPETIRGWQWARLARGLDARRAGNAFWRRRLEAAGLRDPRDLASWDDFARLPRLAKADLAADQAAAPPFGTNRTYPLERYLRVFQTSGTTGPPIRWLDTEESWEWWARCWACVFRAAGLGPGDRLFFPFSFGLFVGFWAGFEGARALGALAIPGGGQDSALRLHAMRELGATALVCTPSYALHLADVARAQGLDPCALPVRVTVHAGEPGAGIAAVRARLEALWGARAYDHAGMTEVGA